VVSLTLDRLINFFIIDIKSDVMLRVKIPHTIFTIDTHQICNLLILRLGERELAIKVLRYTWSTVALWYNTYTTAEKPGKNDLCRSFPIPFSDVENLKFGR
jgi:hypothetical protein